MRRYLIGLTVATATVLGGTAPWAQDSGAIPPAPMLQVTAVGRAAAPPDIATLRIGVETREEKAARALSRNAAATADVIAVLRRAGLEGRDIQTAGLTVNPVYPSGGSYANGGDGIDGYLVINEVSARISDLSALGAILDAVVGAGANRINSLSFEIADPAQVLAEARADAVAQARAAAATYAAAADLALGPILSITDGTTAPGPTPGMAMMRMEASVVPIERGETELTARASIVWALRPLP